MLLRQKFLEVSSHQWQIQKIRREGGSFQKMDTKLFKVFLRRSYAKQVILTVKNTA